MPKSKTLFTEQEFFNETGKQINSEIMLAMRPIIRKFVKQGYRVREICSLIMKASICLEAEFVLEIQHKKLGLKLEGELSESG